MLKGLIPTGGRGTRLRPFTFSTNKHLIPIANKPLVLYPVEALAKAGVKEIGIVTNETLPEVENLLGNGHKWGLKFTYINQPYPGGLAHVIFVSKEFLEGSKFIYHLGDNIFTQGVGETLGRFLKSGADAAVTYLHHPENRRMGVPYFNKDGRFIKYAEKPKNPPHDLAIPGVYFFNENVYRCFEGADKIKPSARNELEISSVFQWLIDKKYKVEAYPMTGSWRDPGQLGDIIETNHLVMDLMTKYRVESYRIRRSKINGRVSVGRGSKIINSLIDGPVIIGNDVEIVNSHLGPYTAVYHNCSIIDSSIEDSLIMERTIISGIKKKVYKSFIGKGVNIHPHQAVPKTHRLILADLSELYL
ncbi:MAG: glucose-1-phosphate thymidylyltransferase [Patescibacteria group bacterium]|nr:glucose-1-phosphate thymidylyltransferase [Patescibacteria group bacterium]